MSTVLIKSSNARKGVAELLGILNPAPPAGARIFIKPNIVIAARPSSAAITDPEVVRGVIRWFKARGHNDIVVGESPALTADSKTCFIQSGYAKMAREEGVELISLNDAPRVEVEWKYGSLSLPEIVFNSYYINVAKLKTHVQTMVTLCLKNQKGLLLDKDKKKFHKLGLHEPVAELSKVAVPALSIIDGIVGMEGDGPLDGRRRKTGFLIGGTDPVEVDRVGCMAMGIDPSEVEHLRALPGAERVPDFRGRELTAGISPFDRPDRTVKKLMKLSSWRSADVCTMCTYNTSLALGRMVKDPRYYPKLLKVLYWSVFRGLNLIYGGLNAGRRFQGKVVLIGNCAKIPYEGLDATRIKGCPPEVNEILDKL